MKLTGCKTLHCDAGWRVFSFLQLTTDEGLTGIAEYNEYYGSPGLTGVIERLAATLGIPLEDRPPLPSASVVAGPEDQAVAVLQRIGATLCVPVPQMRQAALQDVERGNASKSRRHLGIR